MDSYEDVATVPDWCHIRPINVNGFGFIARGKKRLPWRLWIGILNIHSHHRAMPKRMPSVMDPRLHGDDGWKSRDDIRDSRADTLQIRCKGLQYS